MNSKLYLFAAAALMLAMTYGFGILTGKAYCERAHDRAQTELLKADAKKSIELEKAHEKRKETTERSVQVIKQTVDDCVGRRVPDRILDELRPPGGPARPTPAARLREASAGG